MPEDKSTESRVVEPVNVAIIGTGDANRLPSGTIAETVGEHQPNMVVQVVTPLVALVIRFINVFLPVFSGILTGAMASDVIPAHDFLNLVAKCAGLALAGTTLAFIKDLITIFGRLEQKYPLLTGSV